MNLAAPVFVISLIVSVSAICPPRWAQRDQSCYFLFDKPSSRSQAVNLCASHSATLVSYGDKAEWDYLSNLVHSTKLKNGAWTDLKHIRGKSWSWESATQYVELNNWLVKGNISSAPSVNSLDGTALSAVLVSVNERLFLQVAHTLDLNRPFCERDIDSRDLCDGSDGWVKLQTGCYKRFPPDEWNDAIRSCQAEQSRLLLPSNQNELDIAVATFGLGSGMWVDVVADNIAGDNFRTNGHVNVTFLPWLMTAPQKSQESAPGAQTNGYNVTLCQQELPFLCVKPEGSCPLGWEQSGAQCFQVHVRDDERLTWSGAVRHCKRQGAHLAAPDIPFSLKTQISGVLKENDVYSVWVGFSGTSDVYHKLDGSALDTAGHPVVKYDTTHTLGGLQLCGVSDFDPSRNEYLAVYCYTPRSFVCTLPLIDRLITPKPLTKSCSLGWTWYNGLCYRISQLSLSHDEAVRSCAAAQATLATPDDEDAQSMYSSKPFLDVGLGTFWIGVKRSGGGFVLTSNGNSVNFSNFQQTHNNDTTSDTQCVYVSAGSGALFMGAWSSGVCSTKRHFVCTKPANHAVDQTRVTETYWSPLCQVGWFYGTKTNLCYGVFQFSKKSWLEAHAKCGEQNGSLISISSSTEQEEVKNLLTTTTSWNLESPVWVGAREDWAGVGWGWSDNNPMSYFHWDNAEPQYYSEYGDNCGYIPVTDNQFLWRSQPCGDRLGFICKAPASKSHTAISPPSKDKSLCENKALVSGEHSLQFLSDFGASSYKDEHHRPEHCRLVPFNTATWRSAQDSTNEWLSLTFHSPVSISSIALRGDIGTNSYVSTFKLQYRLDALSPWMWYTVSDKNGMRNNVLQGSRSPGATALVLLNGSVSAQAVKIWPVTWINGIALQVELNGCVRDGCDGEYSLGDPLVLPGPAVTASSSVRHTVTRSRSGGVSLSSDIGVRSDTPAWQPQPSDTRPWIQVAFNKPRILTGLTLRGEEISGKSVSKFQLQLSQTVEDLDNNLITYTQPYGVNYTFRGPENSADIQTVYLKSNVLVQVVRIMVKDWPPQGPALMFDIISCPTGCLSQPSLENISPESITASSSMSNMSPDRSRLNSEWGGHLVDGWSPQQNQLPDTEYIQVDLGSVKQVTAVATQGSQAAQAWVRSFYLAFSLDGKTFQRHGGNKSLVYEGNSDSVSVVKNELDRPVNARFVQLWPHQVQSSVALRWEVYTCPIHSSADPIGCYADDPSDRDLKFVMSRDQYSSTWPETCLSQCYKKNFPYAGLQGGDQCYCGEDYGTYGQTDGCDLPCHEPYLNFTCGGVDKNIIYSTGIGITSATCPHGYQPFRDSCYSLVTENSTWLQARSRCVQFGGHLVTIGDSRENEMVTGLLQGVGSAWIGLNDIGKPLTFHWSDKSQVYYTKWGRHQPTVNPGLEQRSVLISAKDGTWSNVFSEGLYPYVCETSMKASDLPRITQQNKGCKKGWLGLSNKCYQLNRTKKTWAEAKSLCGLEQATLVQVDNLEESNFLSTAMVGLSGRYWTDVSSHNFEYRQGEVDNGTQTKALVFTNWAPYKPDTNGGCVSLGTAQHAGEWANQPCTTTNSFICEATRTGISSRTVAPGQPTVNTSASCPSGWLDSGDGICYQVNSMSDIFKVTWPEASEDCRNKGAHLASFHSDYQFHVVADKIRQLGSDVSNFWCGLHNFDIFTGYEWTDQSEMNYVRWHATATPDGGRCGEVRPITGDMATIDCLQHRSWLCAAPRVGACDPLPRPWRKFKDSCYLFADGKGGSDDTLTWREARESCRTDGADLAAIDSEEENRFLQGMLTTGSQTRSVWIGLNELNAGLGYSWSSDSLLHWKLNWNVNEPNDYGGNEACVEILTRNGKWNDEHCSKRQGYVCEQLAPGASSPQTPSSTTPGDSSIPSAQWGCPKRFWKLGQKCYGVFGAEQKSSRLTWDEANNACRKLGMQAQNSGLASITSAVENAFVTTVLREHRVSAWLGLRRTPDGEYRWWDNQDVRFTHWNREEPNMSSGQRSCVYMYGPSLVAGKWNDVNCQELAAYVCQVDADPNLPQQFRPPSSQCSSLDGFQLYGDACFKLSIHPASWSEAEAECVSVGARLVSVMDAYDQAKLSLLSQTAQSELWLGLSDQLTPGKFAWSSGYPVTFTPWADGQPHTHSCAYMDKTGLFRTDSCRQRRPFVCRSDSEPPQASPTPPGGYCKDLNMLGGRFNSTETASTCYYYIPRLVTHTEAASTCKNYGATLASIHDHNTVYTNLSSNVWIAMKKSLEGSYYWLDDSPVDFINWAPTYPNHKDPENICVVMTTDGTWYNEYCLTRLPFLCAASKVYPKQDLTLPSAHRTPPQFVMPTMYTQEIPRPRVETPQPVDSVSSTNSPTLENTDLSSRTTADSDVTPSSSFEISDSVDAGNTTELAVRPTDNASHDSSLLSAGDIAAITLGILVAVLLGVLAAFILVRHRSNIGSVLRGGSPLRRHLSRAKNFENSLYEATRKDTLTARERVETFVAETVVWADLRARSDSNVEVTSGQGGQSGQGPDLILRPVFGIGHRDIESESSTDNQRSSPVLRTVAVEQPKHTVMANGTHNALLITDISMTTQMNGIPRHSPTTLDSQA